MLYATKPWEVTKYYLAFASNCLERPTSTINHSFSLAMPIKRTYQCHVEFPLCMLNVKIGKGRRVIKSISASMHTTVQPPNNGCIHWGQDSCPLMRSCPYLRSAEVLAGHTLNYKAAKLR